jgi:hypothetical protein
VAVEIIIKLGRVNDARVNNRASGAIPRAVSLGRASGKEDGLVALPDNYECNPRVEV